MRPNQPRQKCKCGLIFRYDSDFQEHKRVGCVIEAGKGESLAVDPDNEPNEEVSTEPVTEAAPVIASPKKQSRKK